MLNEISLHTNLCVYGKCDYVAESWTGHVLADHCGKAIHILAGWCCIHGRVLHEIDLTADDKGCYGEWNSGMGVKHV